MRPENLSIELLETFVTIANADGNAATAAEQLGISQPSISKRITALRKATSEPNGEPWLFLKGRRWRLTSQGQRVRGVVTDLVNRYRMLDRFVKSDRESKPIISIACGEQAVNGFIQDAVSEFLKENDCQIRISTPRGKARIEGVAGGQFDLAIVTDNPGTIQLVAQREMYIETLFSDRFVLAGNPHKKASWFSIWQTLSTEKALTASELLELPFIMPEIDSTRRQQFEKWFYKATGQTVNVTLETGGWQTILNFADAGIGVGLVTESAVETYHKNHHTRLSTRQLLSKEFPPDPVRLIARKAFGKNTPDLDEIGLRLVETIGKTCEGR